MGAEWSDESSRNSRVITTATVSKLEASLREYLRRVEAGEEVLIAEPGRRVAKLIAGVGAESLPQYLAAVEKERVVERGSWRLPKNSWTLPRPRDPEGSMVRAALRARQEGWSSVRDTSATVPLCPSEPRSSAVPGNTCGETFGVLRRPLVRYHIQRRIDTPPS